MRDTLFDVSAVESKLDTSTETTLLKALLRQRHLKYETFRAEYQKVARRVAPDDVPPSKAQYYRWLSGQLKGGVPYPDACRVLESMFPPWTAADLFGPYAPNRDLVSQESGTGVAPVGGLLGPVPHSFSASMLSGAWVTCFEFGNEQPRKCHADMAHVTAESDRRVKIVNYPPVPRSEGRVSPFRNVIEAQLANRHLIGHWKNANDTRYFGSFHLAVLPGETVMEGYYTGFGSDIQVSTGRWKWVRLDSASLSDVDLSEIGLRDPATLHRLVENHSQYDASLTLADVGEGY